MTTTFAMKTGEATVLASRDQCTDAMPEIAIGDIAGPVGHSFANLMGQTEGHTRMFAIRATNQQVKPATMMVSKCTIKSVDYVNLLGGPVQSAIADAVLDSVIDGVIDKSLCNQLCIVAMIWLEPKILQEGFIDRKDLYRTNYEAMKLAISRAMQDEPSIETLIENRHTIHHEMYHPETGESIW